VILPTSTSPKCHWHVLLSNITSPVVIFAVLDVTSAVNSCINRGFLHLCLQFYYISPAVAWCRLHGTWSTKFLRCSCRPASPYTKFGTKAVIATYTPNPRCVPNLKLLPSMVAKISRGSRFFGCCPAQPLPICLLSLFLGISYSPNRSWSFSNLKLLASTVAEISRGSQNFWDAPLTPTPAQLRYDTTISLRLCYDRVSHECRATLVR